MRWTIDLNDGSSKTVRCTTRRCPPHAIHGRVPIAPLDLGSQWKIIYRNQMDYRRLSLPRLSCLWLPQGRRRDRGLDLHIPDASFSRPLAFGRVGQDFLVEPHGGIEVELTGPRGQEQPHEVGKNSRIIALNRWSWSMMTRDVVGRITTFIFQTTQVTREFFHFQLRISGMSMPCSMI